MTIDYSKGLPTLVGVIREIDPTAIVVIENDDVDSIEWLEGTTPIDRATILAKKAEIDAEWSKIGRNHTKMPKLNESKTKLTTTSKTIALNAKQ